MQGIQIIMPSQGDMEIVKQEGGSLVLRPFFYGGVCAGPHVRVVEMDNAGTVKKVVGMFRMQIKADGKIELKKGGTAEDEV